MRVIKRKNSYYLQHSFRKNGKTITKEKYLSLQVPEDIEQIKEDLLSECRKEAFYELFDKIKEKFQTEWKRMPASIKDKMIEEYSINLTYNTNAIEGSTISEEETREIVSHGNAPAKPIRDIKETEKHALLFKELLSQKQELTKKTLLNWHNRLFSETKPDMAGRFRDYMVRVGDYRAPDWQDVEKMMKEFFKFCKNKDKLHPVEFVARMHYRFEKIHPFGDGNGRIGRLMHNMALWQKGYPLLVIEYKKRKSYYSAIRKDEEHFVQYFIRRYLAVHKKYL